ncbi:hypothetical protein Poli38472_006234 [Pythium oligandrum]|uniref:Uncharacterized protein n=1 Tax=Pythium oligandrum TaxID=41045 RepID=A0A8K1CS09_PYTOL|nr:hypothetical protein Poli38472_006234 [Pythium oligandrum]|eukprot:TMW68766.1 hypothetical protein Poli38472_006234 [Pythium oligandrum]
MELIRLGDAHEYVGTARNFAAVVQQIAVNKRALIQRQQRVSTYHVLHLADPSKLFFKLTCWGDTPPTLAREDHDGEEISLRVGDIVLFSGCVIKSFRGNIDAQFTRQSSIQLLYRRDRYFNTRAVRLKDFYPMIEWYKQHRHLFLVMTEHEDSASVTAHNSERSHQSNNGTPFLRIRELREDIVASLRVHCVEGKSAEEQDAPPTRSASHSDVDGVLLHEVVMKDKWHDTMVLNLWDQYADKRFVARLLAHQGRLEVCGLVISLNQLSGRLLANTTPQTEFRFIDSDAVQTNDADLSTFSSIDAMESSTNEGKRLVLDHVTIAQVGLGHLLGHASRVEPSYTPLLVECYCAVCEQTLPVLDVQTIPQLYGTCPSRCHVKNGAKDRSWRYRPLWMVLRDAHHQLRVHVPSRVLTTLYSNIDAARLIDTSSPETSKRQSFSARFAVAQLVNALVSNSAQTFRVEVLRSTKSISSQSFRLGLHDSGFSAEDGDHDAATSDHKPYTLVTIQASASSFLSC